MLKLTSSQFNELMIEKLHYTHEIIKHQCNDWSVNQLLVFG